MYNHLRTEVIADALAAGGGDLANLSADQNEPTGSWLSRVKDVGEFIFAGVLMAYGVAGYYLVRGQLRVMQRQTTVMQQQTRVMQKQLADTEKASAESDRTTDRQLKIAESQATSLKALANANKRQLQIAESDADAFRVQAAALTNEADSVRREAEAMSSQAASMKTLADANKAIADAANISAEAAKRSATTSAQQLEVTDRALIRVSASIESPLEFVSTSGENISPDVESTVVQRYGRFVNAVYVAPVFALTNTGRSVANNVQIAWQISFIGPKDLLPFDDIDKVAIKMCDTAANATAILSVRALFPEEKTLHHLSTAELIPQDDIYPPSPDWYSPAARQGITVQLLIVGCVSYNFINSPKTHRTWFTYRIGKRTTPLKAPFQTWNFEIGRRVPPDALFLEKTPYGGNGGD